MGTVNTRKKKTATKNGEYIWTPQMQFSKRIARVVLVVWIAFISVVLTMLVIWREVDALMALTGWVTSVMITMVGAYTGNSMFEKHLDKSLDNGLYRFRTGTSGNNDKNGEDEEETESLGDGEDSDFDPENDQAGKETDSFG